MERGAFLTRLGTAIVILAVVLSLIWAPMLYLGFAIFISVLVAIGLYEYYLMAQRLGLGPDMAGGIALGAAIAFSGWYGIVEGPAFALVAAMVTISIVHMLQGRISLPGIAATMFGIVYVGWFGAHFVMLRGIQPYGPGLVTLLIAAVAVTDAGAYIVGCTMGRHKMAPKISPGKTWEGAVGGLVLALAAVAICYLVSLKFKGLPQWALSRYLFVGAVLSVVGQIGDLTESALKRSAGVKDSGTLFPGHGGVLDRCDGYLLAAPVLYYMSAWGL